MCSFKFMCGAPRIIPGARLPPAQLQGALLSVRMAPLELSPSGLALDGSLDFFLVMAAQCEERLGQALRGSRKERAWA